MSSQAGQPIPAICYKYVSSYIFISRVMRRTGKLYGLTLLSAMCPLYASTMVAMWNDNSSQLHLWSDLIPQGFGMASVITTTFIVGISTSFQMLSLLTPLRLSLLVFPKRTWQWLPAVSRCALVICLSKLSPVTYLFRTTGQVLGVSLSGTLMQAVLLSKLQQRIQGPNAEEVCPPSPFLLIVLNDL